MHLSPGSYQVKDEEDGKFTQLEELFQTMPKTMLYSIDLTERNQEMVVKVN